LDLTTTAHSPATQMPSRRTNSGLMREMNKMKAKMVLLQEKADGFDKLDNKHRRLKKSFKGEIYLFYYALF
jgi:hypothetical protein